MRPHRRIARHFARGGVTATAIAGWMMLVPFCGFTGTVTSTNAVQPAMAATNVPPPETSPAGDTNAPAAGGIVVETYDARLASASYLEKTRQFDKAEKTLLGLLSSDTPDSIQRNALFELAGVAGAENDLPRAETIYAQFLTRWPQDPRVPEVLLHQGQLFRQMGLNNMALAKFYSVMTAALSLKNDQWDYYQRLVLQAQMEIAETHYLAGQFADAADFYSRLLKQGDPALDRPQAQFRLVRSLANINHSDEAASQAQDFLSRYPDAAEEPEVRFYLAEALKQLGRNNEALQQVLLLLQEEKARTRNHPEVWAYWQQRAGNEIANQLYHEGDYVKALEVYVNLARLDPAPSWQIPVEYQIGLTYERLLQPQKAVETYQGISRRESEVGTNASPGLKAVFDMARWRANFLGWQNTAEVLNRSVSDPALAAASPATSISTNSATP